MSTEKRPFVDVDELMRHISVEQVAAFYGVQLPQLHRAGAETRARCFLNCGRAGETGDRVLAIQTDHEAKQWHCHQYGCGKSGNLVSLCDLLKPGSNTGGKPRGDRFKQIAVDMLAMTNGLLRGSDPRITPPAKLVEDAAPKVNLPLAQSENVRARALVDLDRKFVVDLPAMSARGSGYFRRRPFLSQDVCRRWRMGYLPRDTGDDKSGGTMRGKIVYPMLSDDGEVLTWFGRDPEFEDKHAQWENSARHEREPEKFHFVKGFHRGIELFGQHALHGDGVAEKLRLLGLLVVEGPNDVIRLDTLGVPAVGLCSNTITREQASKLACLAREVAGGIVTIFLDCDPEGENGMKQCLGYLAQLVPVRLAWTSKMYAGEFIGRQPESLRSEEWQRISEHLSKPMRVS